MRDQPAMSAWAYHSDDDLWTLNVEDESLALDGAFVRQFARQFLRNQRSRALAALNARYADGPSENAAYGQAVVDLMRGDWALPIAS